MRDWKLARLWLLREMSGASRLTPERQSCVEQLVHEALELEDNERGEFLERQCAGDEDLRVELESLLAFGKDAENFMEAPALQVGRSGC